MRAILIGCAVVAVCLGVAGVASATDFPIVGGSYTANVAVRLDATGANRSSALGTLAGAGSGTQFGSAANTIDNGFTEWALQGLADVNHTATSLVTLDQTYYLNKIHVQYDLMPGQHQVRVFDGTNWTTVQAQSAASSKDITFAAQNVTQVEWTIYGPGVDYGGGPSYAYMIELQAFVAGTGAAPQKEAGYDIGSTMSLVSQSGWISWAQPGAVIDGSPATYAIPDGTATATFDLGAAYPLNRITLDYAYGQAWAGGGKVEIASSLGGPWTTLVDTPGTLADSTYGFGPTNAQYVRITGTGTGALSSLEVYAAPEPATMGLLALGGLAMLRRKMR